MSVMTSQITAIWIVSSTRCSDYQRRKHQGSKLQSICDENHRWWMDSHPQKPVMWKPFPCFCFLGEFKPWFIPCIGHWSVCEMLCYRKQLGPSDGPSCNGWSVSCVFCASYLGDSRVAWWPHQMEAFSALLALCAENSPVTGEFPSQTPVTQSFGVFFNLGLNKRLRKQTRGWWFETPSCSLWRHCNVSYAYAISCSIRS